jgi:hypothetical protein
MAYNYTNNSQMFVNEIDYNKVVGTFPVTYNDSIPFTPYPSVSSSQTTYTTTNTNTYTTSYVPPEVPSSQTTYTNTNTYTTSYVPPPAPSSQTTYTNTNSNTFTTSYVPPQASTSQRIYTTTKRYTTSSVPVESYQSNYTINNYKTDNYIDYGSSNNFQATTNGNYISDFPKRNTHSGYQTSYQTNVSNNFISTTSKYPIIKSSPKYETHTFEASYNDDETFNLNEPANIPNLRSSLKNLKETMDAYLY